MSDALNKHHNSFQDAWTNALVATARHRVWWTRDALHGDGNCWREALAGLSGACVAFIDEGVANAWPGIAECMHAVVANASATKNILVGDSATDNFASCANTSPLTLQAVEIIPGGEICKHGMHYAHRVARACFEFGISRHGCVIAVGGGAVLDAVGFGAAMAHRGVALVRLPTTTLSQDDSAMGVKCGVNDFENKNALGCFVVPHAVVCCERLLTTQPLEYWLGGFSEAVKIALLKDPQLFEQLELHAAALCARDMNAARPIIRRSAQLHRDHIINGGDAFETGSARPLDHGHWAAHRLEVISDWKLPHGQAVAIGIALDSCIAQQLGLLAPAICARILALLRVLQLPAWHPLLQPIPRLMQGLEQFRQHLGGKLSLPLLRDIGSFTEVSELSVSVLQAAVAQLECNRP